MQSSTLKRPNFFIVGAPKCGTTSMYHYLRQHPDIFMPHDEDRYWLAKEPHHHASDLGMTHKVRLEKLDEYMDLFQPASAESRLGEASALYLYSSAAAAQIKQLPDDVKIIIMLRPPMEMIQSWHQDCLRWGHEDIASFTDAVGAEADRKQGKRIPSYCEYPSRLAYSEMGSYFRHLEHYIETFGDQNVSIILLEDLCKEPEATYRSALEFLGVDPSFVPNYEIQNEAQTLDDTHIATQKFKMFLMHKARFVYTVFQKLTPQQQEFIRSVQKSFTSRKKSEVDVPNERLLQDLRAKYKPEIQQLSHLLNRDLDHWYN